MLCCFVLIAVFSCSEVPPDCNESWYRDIESEILTGDGQGHGPDPGSDEWRSVIEFKLGIRGQADLPDRSTDEWCRFIERYIESGE